VEKAKPGAGQGIPGSLKRGGKGPQLAGPGEQSQFRKSVKGWQKRKRGHKSGGGGGFKGQRPRYSKAKRILKKTGEKGEITENLKESTAGWGRRKQSRKQKVTGKKKGAALKCPTGEKKSRGRKKAKKERKRWKNEEKTTGNLRGKNLDRTGKGGEAKEQNSGEKRKNLKGRKGSGSSLAGEIQVYYGGKRAKEG